MTAAAMFLMAGDSPHQSGVYTGTPSAPYPRIWPEKEMGTPAAASSAPRYWAPMSWAAPKIHPPGTLVGGMNGSAFPTHTGGTTGSVPGMMTQSAPHG